MQLEVVRGVDLYNADQFGVSDPYVKIIFEEGVAYPNELATPVIENSLNPVWNVKQFVLLKPQCIGFRVEVWDQDPGFDDSLGIVYIQRDSFKPGLAQGGQYVLDGGKGGRVEIKFTEITLADAGTHVIPAEILEEESNKSNQDAFTLVCIHLVEAKGLDKADVIGLSDPYVKFTLPDKAFPDKVRSRIIKGSLNPVWDQRFAFLLQSYQGKEFPKIEFELFDHDLLMKDDFLGRAKAVIPHIGRKKDQEILIRGGGGTIHMTVSHFPLRALFYGIK